MKSFKNELGWYFKGYEIRRKCPSKKSLSNHIVKEILIWVITLIILFAVMIAKGFPLIFALSLITFSSLFFGIIGILRKFWLLRILSFQPRTNSLILNDVIINNPRKNQRLPCYLFKAEIDHESDSDLYRVYLRPSEFLEIEGNSQLQNVLVWETTDEQEAEQIVDELRQCGIGETDFEKQHPVVPGNKKIGLFVLVCYILCLLAVMFLYIKPSVKSEMANNPDSIEPLLLVSQFVLIFGLLSIVIYACYNIWFGLMAIKHHQIPAPGTIFFGDMRLFQGDIAVKRGRRTVVTAAAIIILSLIGGIYVHYNLESLIGMQNNQEIKTTQNQ